MNENLNLVEILKDCPSGTKLYSPALGEVDFVDILEDCTYNIRVKGECGTFHFTPQGKLFNTEQGECILFPSKDQRDWSKFKPKQPKFDPNTLKSFDKVLVRDGKAESWMCDIYSHKLKDDNFYVCISNEYYYCIPYNEETKHLVGTTEDASEFYKYWED